MYLFIGGQEWIIVLIAIIIILIWGPSKLPSLARGMGEAIREFRKAASGVEEESKKTERKEEIDQKLLETARSLGISTEGKTREQILEEINRKIAELKKER